MKMSMFFKIILLALAFLLVLIVVRYFLCINKANTRLNSYKEMTSSINTSFGKMTYIDKVYVLATSAGGTPAIRFALDYPERTKGLILYCSSMPYSVKPDTNEEYVGPPKQVCNNFTMWLISPLFEPLMGMDRSTINEILPINEKRDGIVFDSKVVNTDMNKNFD